MQPFPIDCADLVAQHYAADCQPGRPSATPSRPDRAKGYDTRNGTGQCHAESVKGFRRQHQRRASALLLVPGTWIEVKADDVAAPGRVARAPGQHGRSPDFATDRLGVAPALGAGHVTGLHSGQQSVQGVSRAGG